MIGVVVAVSQVADAGAVGIVVVVFDAAITTQRAGVVGIDRAVDERRAGGAVATKARVLPGAVAGAVAARVEVAGHRGRLSRAVPRDGAEAVAFRERRLVVAFSAAVAASALIEPFVAGLAGVASPFVGADAGAVRSKITADASGISRAVVLVRASQGAPITVGFEDVNADGAVTFSTVVVGVWAILADRTFPVIAAVTDTTKLAVTVDGGSVTTAVGFVRARFSTAGVVGSAFSAEATVSCFVVESRVAERAVVAFPGVAALALAASASVARHIHSVAIAVFFIRAVGGAGRIATEVGGAGGAVGVGIVSFRAHRAVGASPGVHALAGAVGVKTRNTHGVGGAVRDVLALPAAVGVDTVVAISDVAGGAVVGGRGREVGGAEFASRSVPLIGAVAGAVGNQS